MLVWRALPRDRREAQAREENVKIESGPQTSFRDPVVERVYREVSHVCICVIVTSDRSALDWLQGLSEADGFLRVSVCMRMYTDSECSDENVSVKSRALACHEFSVVPQTLIHVSAPNSELFRHAPQDNEKAEVECTWLTAHRQSSVVQ